jgi:two-component system, chemotaxis family, protein-glutamate methylesterase/glutaminase
LNQENNQKVIVIGGSAGSFQSILHILEELPKNFNIPIIITIHRLKHIRSGLVESVSIKSNATIIEPFDKEDIKPNNIYIAPSNYHLFIEPDYSFSLSTEEPIEFSRPSIDVLFSSAGKVYKNNVISILLSGANKDGAKGVKSIKENGGIVIIQDPNESEVDIMPKSALEMITPDYIFKIEEIITFLQNLNTKI